MSEIILAVGDKLQEGYTWVGVDDIRGVDPTPFPNKDVGIAFLQWLRDVDELTRVNILAALVTEYKEKFFASKGTDHG